MKKESRLIQEKIDSIYRLISEEQLYLAIRIDEYRNEIKRLQNKLK